MFLSIIIPVFNEEKTIHKVVTKLLTHKHLTVPFEIIVIDDGSTDTTKRKLEKFVSLPRVTVLSHKKNLGKGRAVVNGIKKAKGKYILIQDADLEYDPVFIPKLLEPVQNKNAQVVFGTRLNRWPNLKKDERTPLFFMHFVGNRLLSMITSLLYGVWITDMETGYKLFPKAALRQTTIHAHGFEFEPEITSKLLKKRYTILEVPITTKPRDYTQGKKLQTIPEGFKAFYALIKYRFS